jgi:hypothetical protein
MATRAATFAFAHAARAYWLARLAAVAGERGG